MKRKEAKKQAANTDIIVGSAVAARTSKPIIIVVGAIVLVLIAIGGYFGYKYYFDKKDEDTQVALFDRVQFDKDAAEKEASSSLAESRAIAIEDAKLDPESLNNPGNPLLNESQQAAAEGNFATAIDKLNQYIAENPTVSYTIYIDLGLYYKRVNNTEQAKIAYMKAAELAKNDPALQEEDIESTLRSIELSSRGL
jgi:cytochrome c-type biogenesis protein CcmH/NrfG